jgi:hypothetical protein
MKTKYILASSFIVSLLALTACSDFLDVSPQDSLTANEIVIKDKASAESAVRGVYSGLADAGYYGTSFQSIAYLSGDNVQWTGSQSQVQEFINHKVNADNATISSAWNAIYRTINRANYVISDVPQVSDPVLTDALRNQYLGEAYFIRALAYFDLARTWGGVPIILAPTRVPTDNIEIGRSTQAATYTQALSDLETAEPLLPETTDRYRATRKTVWALKSRYYLYQQNWVKAEEYASKLIADTKYRLLKPFSSFSTNNARGTEESVFEIFYNGTTEQNTHRNQWQPQTNGGTRQWAPNDAFVKLANDPLIGGNRSVLVAKDNQNRWYGNLYYSATSADPSYIFRIAELYLIRAEARAQQNKLDDAKSDLNAVRDRAGLTATTATAQADILLAIENERRIEFALEAHRWFDLVRTDRAVTVLGIKAEEKFRYLLPLPADQILVDKTLAKDQNPGY